MKSAVVSKFANLTISDPPRFEVSKYEAFRRELLWWRDSHSSFEDSVLITTLAIKAVDDSLKSLLTSFMESAREDRSTRNFCRLVNLLDKEYAKTSEELALGKMSIWSSFERKSPETLRSFRQRFGRVVYSLGRSGIHMPGNIRFNKALSSLKLPSNQLSVALSTIEAKNVTTLVELRRITIRLFVSNFLEQSDCILKVESSHSEASEDSAPAETEEWDETEIPDAFIDGNGDIFEVRRVAAKSKSKSKSLYLNSVNSARGHYGLANRDPGVAGAPKGSAVSGKTGPAVAKCWRCGKSDHYWGNCHLPWQKNLSFAPKPAEQLRIVDSSLLMTETIPDTTPAVVKLAPRDLCPVIPRELPKDAEKCTEDEWISRYNLSLGSVLTCISSEDNVPMQSSIMCVRSSSFSNIVIDNGATSYVVGKTWLTTYHKFHRRKNPLASVRSFKFGDSRSVQKQRRGVYNGVDSPFGPKQ